MKRFRELLLKTLGAKTSLFLLVVFCILSFAFGQALNDMNLFASSGAIISVFGLLYTIKYTTLKKLSNQEAEVSSRSGVTGPPLTEEEYNKIVEANLKQARIDVREELKSEILGVGLAIFGTFVWAYGGYITIIQPFAVWMQTILGMR
ncbi:MULTISPECIES: hypothetical protein [Enterobacteriaceae]|jgi:hypothetical protein|uniref:hypothetical protein n=1 Tax=Enterobacteriaceae TaxID=543 RepID=UPI0005300F86|nr:MULTISPECIES: hypothetical protein [Enterobacteriaceae]EEU9284551.1 hypothetical protein [Escherichia coli]HAS1812248.1 hypothetical protein [Enterobacter hormaechei subsp. xiangfangensis]HCR2172681.1 hypothetical protein [Enterobacter roggenkampii]HDT5530122.1 hypothetical protein [Klebsiella pneumoniae subsp. ozaenae]HED2149862.1 hypothetical protein [Enterobacter hormaechei subsp. hormaechei]